MAPITSRSTPCGNSLRTTHESGPALHWRSLSWMVCRSPPQPGQHRDVLYSSTRSTVLACMSSRRSALRGTARFLRYPAGKSPSPNATTLCLPSPGRMRIASSLHRTRCSLSCFSFSGSKPTGAAPPRASRINLRRATLVRPRMAFASRCRACWRPLNAEKRTFRRSTLKFSSILTLSVRPQTARYFSSAPGSPWQALPASCFESSSMAFLYL